MSVVAVYVERSHNMVTFADFDAPRPWVLALRYVWVAVSSDCLGFVAVICLMWTICHSSLF